MKNAVLLFVVFLVFGSLAQASTTTYAITVNTSTSPGWDLISAGPPYSLDFQFTDGSTGDPNNTATVDSTDFTGFTLTDGTPPFSGEQIIPFTPTDQLSFIVTLTENEDVSGQPDLFSFAILDQNFNELPTSDPSGANTIVNIAESTDPGSSGALTAQTFDTQGNDFLADITAVPEPGTLPLSLLVGSGILACRRGFARRPATKR